MVGVVDEPRGRRRRHWPLPGTRVVVEPVLGCAPGASIPPCPACAEGRVGGCERIAFGHLAPGLQIGFCADTGGGWSQAGLVAHGSQLHAVPDALSDDDAVMVEPTACAVHGALAAGIEPGDTVAVLGRRHRRASPPRPPCANWPPRRPARGGQVRRTSDAWPASSAPTWSSTPTSCPGRASPVAVARHVGHLTGGADVVVDCVGSADSLAEALAMVRPRGTVVLVGMPGKVSIDLASLWHREVSLVGAYAYGTETLGGARCGAPSTSPWRWWPPPASAGWCRPATPSTASRRPWPTPGPPGAGRREGRLRPARHRSGKDLPS